MMPSRLEDRSTAPRLLVALLLIAGAAGAPCTQQELNSGRVDAAGNCEDCGYHSFCAGNIRTRCSPWTGTTTTTATTEAACVVLKCNACPDASPVAVFSAGRGAAAPNALFITLDGLPLASPAPATVRFMCTVPTSAGLADVAYLHQGDVLAMDVLGSLWLLPAESVAELAATAASHSPSYSRACSDHGIVRLASLPASVARAVTGLGISARSDVFYVTSNNGDVTSVQVADPSTTASSFTAVTTVNAPTDSTLTSAPSGTNGGTDVTVGPDGGAWRWSVKDARHTVHTATRLGVGADYHLDGTSQLVTRGLAYTPSAGGETGLDSAEFSNGGALCSSGAALGVTAQHAGGVPKRLAKTAFFSLSGTSPAPPSYPSALMLGQPVAVNEAQALTLSDEFGIDGAFRQNGAGAKPVCSTAY